ncbi:MAG: DUF167 domain-containing protein [Bdellovibrionales bacterium]|nr:DUF167 domain-containing protein [Bdellovibrionales bacterium]
MEFDRTAQCIQIRDHWEHNGSLKIRIKAPPVDGKANEAVESFISDFLRYVRDK